MSSLAPLCRRKLYEGMIDSGTRSRGSFKCATCQSSEYLPPTRARSGPVLFEPHWNGKSYMLSAASE